MKEIQISDRTVFLDVNGVRAARGCRADAVAAMVEAGELLWVFDVSPAHGRNHNRNLRFWAPELIDGSAMSKLKLDAVISQILPVARRSFNGSELGQWFLISRPTVKRLGAELGGTLKNGLLQFPRERLASYLRARWIGGQG